MDLFSTLMTFKTGFYLTITSFYDLFYKVVTSGLDREISTACRQFSSSDEYEYDCLVFQHCNLKISNYLSFSSELSQGFLLAGLSSFSHM